MKSLKKPTEIYVPIYARMSLKNYPIDVKLQCICVRNEIKAPAIVFGLLLILLTGIIIVGCIYFFIADK